MSLIELRKSLESSQLSWTLVEEADVASRERLRQSLGLPEASLVDALRAASQTPPPPFSSSRVAKPSFDWRANNGNWLGKVRDQNTCRSCTAFALCAVMEAKHRIQINNANDPIDLSPADLFFGGHNGDCEGPGITTLDAITRARLHGVALEADSPFTLKRPAQVAAPFLKIDDFSYISGDLRLRKLVIEDHGPVFGIFNVFEDFFLHNAGVYRHSAGPGVALHAVAVVGYDDANSCWICKNSWGPNIGEDGFFRIAYGECELDTRPFISLTVARVEP